MLAGVLRDSPVEESSMSFRLHTEGRIHFAMSLKAAERNKQSETA